MDSDKNPQPDPSAQEKARRAEQFAYAGALAGGLIHEIRNSLSAMRINTQLLAEDRRRPPGRAKR